MSFQREIIKEVLSDREIKKFFRNELLKDEEFKREIFKDISFRMGRRGFFTKLAQAGVVALGLASFIGKADANVIVSDSHVTVDYTWYFPLPLPVSAMVFIDGNHVLSINYKGALIDKGINTVNDAKVLQSTFDYITDGANVHIAKGKYYINQTLRIDKHNVTLSGEKGGRCKDGLPTSKLVLSANVNMFEFTEEGQAGVAFKEIVFGGYNRYYDSAIIEACKVDRFTFENVMFCNHGGVCIHAQECNDWVLNNVMIYRCGNYDAGKSIIEIDRPSTPRDTGASIGWKVILLLVEEPYGRFLTAYDQTRERTIENWDFTDCKIHGFKDGTSQWEAMLLDNVQGLTIKGGEMSYHKNLIKITNSESERIKLAEVKFYSNQNYQDYDIVVQEGRLVTIIGCSFKVDSAGKVHVLFGSNAGVGNSVEGCTWCHDSNMQVLVDNESGHRVLVRNCWRNDGKGYENMGIDVFSGTSADDTFVNNDHGLVDNPTDRAKILCYAIPQSPDAQAAGPVAAYPADKDGDGKYESLMFVFATAPKIGTDNVVLTWFAELVV